MLKKIFIPGWMDTTDNHVDFEGLDIWKTKIDYQDKIEAEYVIGHSLGANFALLNWAKNRNTKLILSGPLLPKRNIGEWLFRWLKFLISEGTKINKKRLSCFKNFFRNIGQCIFLAGKDLDYIFQEIPKESILVIKGKEDKFFCDIETVNFLRSRNIKVLEIEGAGHGWNEKFRKEIDNAIK